RNRRLTHPKFLAFYKDLLIDGGVVEQKTDNLPFFNFSIESFDGELWTILYKTNDLYSDDVSDNIQTEYERRFVSGGMTINKLIATPPKKDE
ncbi:MAG: tRNA (guanosine(46)-N7)-methyltransferase TrmB, partial [Clostridia bacterium]|nr:tRNA (guanosine(46)-N7)-methyltransferase TrmB [Clostridia bacterium]